MISFAHLSQNLSYHQLIPWFTLTKLQKNIEFQEIMQVKICGSPDSQSEM